MTNANKVIELIEKTFAYYGKTLTDEVAAMYALGLSDMSAEEVRQALSAHMRNPDKGQWIPKVSDLVAFRTGNSDAQADAAWAKVHHAVGSVGGYESVVFDDALIHAVIGMMGGWIRFCTQETHDALDWMGKDFRRIYKGLLNNPLPDYPRVLVGIAETHNSAHGFEVAPPKLYGRRDKALLVYNSGSDKPMLPVSTMRINETLKQLGFAVNDAGDAA